MTQHKVFIRSIKLSTGENVDLHYWGSGTSIYVAGFIKDKQATASYSGETEIADDFSSYFCQSLISGLADSVEDELHRRPPLF